MMGMGNYPYGPQVIPYSATPTFDCSTGNVFTMTLTGNVTSMTVINAMPGQNVTFVFKQDSSGLHSVAWPANFKGVLTIPAIGSLANTAAVQEVFYDDSSGNFYALSTGLLNL